MGYDDAEAQRLLADVVAGLEAALGEGLVGVYLYGSYVSGGFDPGVSDVDLVAVTAVDAADLDLPALDGVHTDVIARYPDWADRLEIVYVGQDALRSFRTSPGRVAVISPGEPFHLRDESPGEWVQNWYLVRETGVVLRGPEPAAVVRHVPWEEFSAASGRYAHEIAGRNLAEASGGSLAYTVLTMCRALMTVERDRHGSKQEAAAWVQAELQAWADFIDAALRCRMTRGLMGFDDPTSRTAAQEFIDVLAARIRARS